MLFKQLLILTVCFIGLTVSELKEGKSEQLKQVDVSPNDTANETTTTKKTITTTLSNDALKKPTVLNFTLPKPKDSNDTCLLLQFAIEMEIRYVATTGNTSLKVEIPSDYNDYSGVCGKDLKYNNFTLRFWNNWTLDIEYTLTGDKYELSSMILNYYINSTWFPNAAKADTYTANASNLHEFSANKGNSYKCNAETTIHLGDNVKFTISNYQGEPFYVADHQHNKKTPFHTAVDCKSDQTGTSKLVPIIVGSALAVLILLVLIAYLIGRRKHRTGYQSV